MNARVERRESPTALVMKARDSRASVNQDGRGLPCQWFTD